MKAENRTHVRVIALLTAIAIPLAIGVFSAFLTAKDMTDYDSMARPPLAPPSWLFPIVWTILYVAMGVASCLVYESDAIPYRKRTSLLPYAAQLIMNMFWPVLFFTYRRYLISLLWLLAMWGLILFCAIRFYRINRTAGLLMIVLFLWTTFASYLNLAYYILKIRPVPVPG